jgi:hypothetical protein
MKRGSIEEFLGLPERKQRTAPVPIKPVRSNWRPVEKQESIEDRLLREARERAKLRLDIERAKREEDRLVEQGRKNFEIRRGSIEEFRHECQWDILDLAAKAMLDERTVRRHIKGKPISQDARDRYNEAFSTQLDCFVQIT